jgi:hypothetical protein
MIADTPPAVPPRIFNALLLVAPLWLNVKVDAGVVPVAMVGVRAQVSATAAEPL